MTHLKDMRPTPRSILMREYIDKFRDLEVAIAHVVGEAGDKKRSDSVLIRKCAQRIISLACDFGAYLAEHLKLHETLDPQGFVRVCDEALDELAGRSAPRFSVPSSFKERYSPHMYDILHYQMEFVAQMLFPKDFSELVREAIHERRRTLAL